MESAVTSSSSVLMNEADLNHLEQKNNLGVKVYDSRRLESENRGYSGEA